MKYLHDEAPEHIIHRDLKCSNSKIEKKKEILTQIVFCFCLVLILEAY